MRFVFKTVSVISRHEIVRRPSGLSMAVMKTRQNSRRKSTSTTTSTANQPGGKKKRAFAVPLMMRREPAVKRTMTDMLLELEAHDRRRGDGTVQRERGASGLPPKD
jgi:hypothetical protein